MAGDAYLEVSVHDFVLVQVLESPDAGDEDFPNEVFLNERGIFLVRLNEGKHIAPVCVLHYDATRVNKFRTNPNSQVITAPERLG
jgi:hypothetical protein